MSDTCYNKKRVIMYLAWTFAMAYVMQVGVGLLYRSGNTMAGQLLLAGSMFVPTAGYLLSGGKLAGLGWRLRIRKNIGTLLFAWFAPMLLSIIGAALYFLVFPKHFDLSGGYVTAAAGAEALEQIREQGISYPTAVLLSAVMCVTYAPLVNAFTGLGEEIGWRGFLYPQLKARFGRTKGLLLGGVIWGAWHWPCIWLIGYEYGAAVANTRGYAGFPFSGMLLFLIFTISAGILCDWLYERSGCIWAASIFHGAINAAVTIPLTVCLTETGSARLLGPSAMGVLAGIPFLAAALLVLFLQNRKQQPAE